MWITDQLGLAVWRDEQSQWAIEARGGKFGIGVVVGDEPNRGEDARRYVTFGPVEQDTLPAAGEKYVRGDVWNVNYPQDDSSYALRLALRPVETTKDRIVLEATLSIQTSLLDTHPKIDVDVLCQSIESFVPNDPTGDDDVDAAGSAPISLATSIDHSVAILLGPHDSPFTTNHSTDSLLRLRLFGDFLEKGVIRKARPWIVIDRSGTPTAESQLESYWKQLCGSPLPLNS